VILLWGAPGDDPLDGFVDRERLEEIGDAIEALVVSQLQVERRGHDEDDPVETTGVAGEEVRDRALAERRADGVGCVVLTRHGIEIVGEITEPVVAGLGRAGMRVTAEAEAYFRAGCHRRERGELHARVREPVREHGHRLALPLDLDVQSRAVVGRDLRHAGSATLRRGRRRRSRPRKGYERRGRAGCRPGRGRRRCTRS